MSLATPVGSQENTGPKEWKHIRPIEINAYKLWWVFNEMDLGNLCRCFDSRRPKGEQQCPKCAHWPEAANLRSCWEKTPEGWTNCRRCHEYWKEESIKRAKEDSPSNTLRAHHGSATDAADPATPGTTEALSNRIEELSEQLESWVAAPVEDHQVEEDHHQVEGVKNIAAAVKDQGSRLKSLEEEFRKLQQHLLMFVTALDSGVSFAKLALPDGPDVQR